MNSPNRSAAASGGPSHQPQPQPQPQPPQPQQSPQQPGSRARSPPPPSTPQQQQQQQPSALPRPVNVPRSPLDVVKLNRERRPQSRHNEMSSHPAASSIPSRLSTPQPLPHLQQKGKEKASANEQASGLPAQPKSSILDSPMERFDFEDFRARFDAAMEPHMIRDRELVEEYKRIAATFQAWVSVMGQFDQQSDLTRRESQISNLNQKEAELEAYRKQSQSAVQDIQNILDKMGSAPRYETNSIGSPNPKRNAATYHGPQHRLGRSFMGNKVPGSASLKK